MKQRDELRQHMLLKLGAELRSSSLLLAIQQVQATSASERSQRYPDVSRGAAHAQTLGIQGGEGAITFPCDRIEYITQRDVMHIN